MKWLQKLPYAEITTMYSSENVIHTEHTLKIQHRYQQLTSLHFIVTFFTHSQLHRESCVDTDPMVLFLG